MPEGPGTIGPYKECRGPGRNQSLSGRTLGTDPPTGGERRSLGSPPEVEFGEQRRHVVLHGLLADVHHRTDLAVRLALGDEGEHPALLRRQRIRRVLAVGCQSPKSGQQGSGDGGVQQRSTRRRDLDRADQILRAGAFYRVSALQVPFKEKEVVVATPEPVVLAYRNRGFSELEARGVRGTVWSHKPNGLLRRGLGASSGQVVANLVRGNRLGTVEDAGIPPADENQEVNRHAVPHHPDAHS